VGRRFDPDRAHITNVRFILFTRQMYIIFVDVIRGNDGWL